MNFLNKKICWLLLAAILSASFSKKSNSDKVKITISKAEGTPTSMLKIYHYPSMEAVILEEEKLDPGDTANLEIDVLNLLMANIQIGDINKIIFLEPGYDLTISIEGDSLNKKLIFTGKGADANNYLSQVSSIYDKVWKRGIANLELVNFLARYDSIKTELENFHKDYIDTHTLSSEVTELLENTNTIQLLKMRMVYAFHLHNSALADQLYAFRDKKSIEPFVMPSELKGVVTEIPFDTTFFKMELYGYRDLLIYYMMEIENQHVIVENWNKPNLNLPIESDQKIKEGNYPSIIQEFFIARNINTWMSEQGITPQVDSLYSDFKRNFSSSIYLADLQKTYEGQIAILPGTVAPDFSGQTITGKVVSLSDFKGKIVYVDVWATWCGPCVEEIPHAIELQSQFKNNGEVVFVNLSRDEDVDKWKRFLLKKEQWKGVHINQSTEQSEVTSNDYKVVGYPQYFIIDQAGKIVTAKAPRPSNSSVKRMLEDLLNPI